MGKKGNKRKTRWRVLPIGDNGDSLCSTNDDDGDGDRVSSSPTTPVNGSWSNGRPAFSPRGPPKLGKQRFGYQQSSYRQHSQRGVYNDSKPPTVTTEKKTFNEEEYTKITTPRQDVLFKKGYLGRKKPALTNATNGADATVAPSSESHPCDNAGSADHELTEPPETPHFLCTNGFVDQGGVYYINGGSYELYDPYTGNVTVVVGPAPHGPPVLAAVSCQPVPLQPLEWFNPPFHSYISAACPDRRKRSSTDSQNWSPQSSESTDPPGSPQEGEEVGLQNGVAEPLEDCTVYQHPHQPPAYVYPGYMFGPAVYNMNGINIQGLPPQPQSIDISGSKRRKKKRRRRRRRGGVEDGSDESTSDENELEEPVSLTSQESSQELESDSKNSAESTSCQGGNAEPNSSEPAQNSSEINSVVLSENTSHDQCAVKNSSSFELQPTVNEYSRSFETDRSEDNRDAPITNSCVPDFSENFPVYTVNQHLDYPEEQTTLSKGIGDVIPVQDACDDTKITGPSKITNYTVEFNNATNSINCPANSPKIIQNSPCNGIDGSGLTNGTIAKEKNKGKRASKGNKQKQQQINHADYIEVQVTHEQLQTIPKKMDGNECSKTRISNDDADRTDSANETKVKENGESNRLDQIKSSNMTSVTSSEETSNEPPKKPSRKDPSQKQSLKKISSTAPKERKDRIGAPKPSKSHLQCSFDTPCDNQTSSPETHFTKSGRQTGELVNLPSSETGLCVEVSEVAECVSSSPSIKPLSSHLEKITPIYSVDKRAEPSIVDKEPECNYSGTSKKSGSNADSTIDGCNSESISVNESKKASNLSEEVIPSTIVTHSSKPPEKEKDTRSKDHIIVEERLSPPPIPPPRRKKWHPYVKRPSIERPPTPGRDLDDRRSSEVLTDDSSSTSTSRDSEESVIEIVPSLRSSKSEDDDTQPLSNMVHEVQHQISVPEAKIPIDTQVSTSEVNVFSSRPKDSIANSLLKGKNSSSDIAQHLLDLGQDTHTSNFQLNDSIRQINSGPGESNKQTNEVSESRHHRRIEKFSEDMATRVIEEALLTIKIGKPEQTLSWPITEAVTRWLRSQSTEEVLSLRDLQDSENDFTDDIEDENAKVENAILETSAGPKNVLRNPLPALLHKCSCTDDDVGIRVATDNFELKHLRSKRSPSLTDTSNYDDKVHDINNNNKKKDVLDTLSAVSSNYSTKPEMQCNDTYYHIVSNEAAIMNNFNAKDTKLNEANYHTPLEVAEIASSSVQDDIDSIMTNESVEYDADWECDTVTLKPSLHTSNINDINLISESLDCQCLHMCDPALSVAKYYRLGPPTDKADIISPDQMSNSCVESEEEIDSLEHFRNEFYDSAYDSSHRSLADELAFSEKPLPESWSIDHIKISKECSTGTPNILKIRYSDCKASDSGIQSEESGNEDSRKPSSNSSSIFSNSSKLFNPSSAIHMTGLTSEGPFPCGGICCILQ